MELRIRQYIERAFADVPKTTKNNELKESLYSDVIDKYHDRISGGKTEEEAYGEVISGIGDLSELTQGLIREAEQQQVETMQDRKRSALLVATSVGLYILSPLTFLICSHFGQGFLGLCLLFVMVAMATGIIIYYSMTKPVWKKQQEDRDEVEQWLPTKQRRLYGTISGALWVLAVVVYITISFTYGNWHFSWVVFLIAVVLQMVIRAILAAKYSE